MSALLSDLGALGANLDALGANLGALWANLDALGADLGTLERLLASTEKLVGSVGRPLTQQLPVQTKLDLNFQNCFRLQLYIVASAMPAAPELDKTSANATERQCNITTRCDEKNTKLLQMQLNEQCNKTIRRWISTGAL